MKTLLNAAPKLLSKYISSFKINCNAKIACAGVTFCLVNSSMALEAQPFPSSHDQVPAGWTGPVFKLSQNYPNSLPPEEALPWATIDFTTQPQQFVQALYNYALEGNVEANWVVQKNNIRKWYHAPWMHYGDSGREFIHGLTRERSTPAAATAGKGELGPDQVHCAQNWAVGFFNPRGGYQVGRVWADPKNPNAALAQFPEGTVVAKLLFTSAPQSEVPYLKNTFEWQANVHKLPANTCPTGALPRQPQTMRLLQMDLAVKDKRAVETGWLFATMSYNGNASGATVWERMEPVGLMWGNTLASQQWINTLIGTPQHLGFEGRLNGPVDNPRSSCISCHATAETPSLSPMIPPSNNTARWFVNYLGSQPFDVGAVPTDYSLQLAMGIQNLKKASPKAPTLTNIETILLRKTFDSGSEEAAQIKIHDKLEYSIGR